MSFTASQLKDQFRLDVDDLEEPGDGDDSESLWKDSEIYAYMDRAQKEFAYETEILLDSTTTAITQLAITADDPWVDIDPRIITINRAKLSSTNARVIPKKFEEMDQNFMIDDYGPNSASDWESVTGTPYFIITNLEADRGRLVPTPTANDTLQLTVVRYPLNPVLKASSVLEITNTKHQYIMLDAMKWFAYEKQDADIFNLDISQRYRNKFMQQVEELNMKLRKKRRPGRSVVYGGL